MELGRIDQTFQEYHDEHISKKIYVRSTGKAPYLIEEPPSDWKMEIESGLEIPFSKFMDPEGKQVFFTIRLRKAHKFAKPTLQSLLRPC